MVTYIYVLKCPKTNEVRYVGKSNNPKRRYCGHMRTDKTACSYKINWVQSLLKQGLKPVLKIIREVPIDEWKDWEKYYIEYYKDKGCKLTNLGQGGEGLNFGNQTSFKKGQKAWNKGTRKKKKCIICPTYFEVSPTGDKRYKCCSMKCSLVYRSLHPNKGTFKKGSVPWNKNKKGYTTKHKGYIPSKKTIELISKALTGRSNKGSWKPVIQLNKDTGKVIKKFQSIKSAAEYTNIGYASIVNTANGYSKTAGGYGWRKGD